MNRLRKDCMPIPYNVDINFFAVSSITPCYIRMLNKICTFKSHSRLTCYYFLKYWQLTCWSKYNFWGPGTMNNMEWWHHNRPLQWWSAYIPICCFSSLISCVSPTITALWDPGMLAIDLWGPMNSVPMHSFYSNHCWHLLLKHVRLLLVVLVLTSVMLLRLINRLLLLLLL